MKLRRQENYKKSLKCQIKERQKQKGLKSRQGLKSKLEGRRTIVDLKDN